MMMSMFRPQLSAWKFLSLVAPLGVLAAVSIGSGEAAQRTDYFVYVGIYGKGVYGYRFHVDSGSLEPLGLLGEITNPSFLATDPSYRFLYAASELDGKVDGAVGAFSIDRTNGSLKALNSKSSHGQAPCYVAVDHAGKMVLAANYGTGELIAYPINENGSLGELPQIMTAHGSSVDPQRQEGPHAHESVPSPDNRFVYVPDLGLDHIRIYALDAATQKLAAANPPFAKLHPGNGPRHIAITKDGKFAYVVSEQIGRAHV